MRVVGRCHIATGKPHRHVSGLRRGLRGGAVSHCNRETSQRSRVFLCVPCQHAGSPLDSIKPAGENRIGNNRYGVEVAVESAAGIVFFDAKADLDPRIGWHR